MTNKQQAEQLRIATEIIETGRGWQVLDSLGQWIDCQGNPVFALHDGRHMRFKPDAEIPVPEGWRELRDNEKRGQWIDGAKYLFNGVWKHFDGNTRRRKGGCYASIERIIVPVPKPSVPLEPCDVPPGSVIRLPQFHDGVFCLIVNQNVSDGVCIVNHGRDVEQISWERLKDENWQIKFPGEADWKPCCKPAQ